MNFFAFILWIIAAVVFLLVPDTYVNGRWGGRSAVAFGLCLFTVGAIVQLVTTNHPIHT